MVPNRILSGCNSHQPLLTRASVTLLKRIIRRWADCRCRRDVLECQRAAWQIWLNRLSLGCNADSANSQDGERLQDRETPSACPDERCGAGGGCFRRVGVLCVEWCSRCREDRRRHILAVAEEMGFQPSRTARDLRSGTTRSIELLLADIANPFYTEVAAEWLPRQRKPGTRSPLRTSVSTWLAKPTLLMG